jgi:hypothetical protein
MPILPFVAPLAAVAALHTSPAPIKATVTLRDHFTVTRAGAPLRTLPHGRYVVVVRDESYGYGFAIDGPGIHRWTMDTWVGTARWGVTLRKGTYVFAMHVPGSVDTPDDPELPGRAHLRIRVRVT